MTNSAHIFKELKLLLPDLQKKYKPRDLFYIGLRLNDKQVAKVEVFFEELTVALFNIIDTNNRPDLSADKLHPIWKTKDYAGRVLVSVFICDVSSQTVYDSRYYQQSNVKYNLQKDKDPRLMQFKYLSDNDKQQVLDLTVAQIIKMQENYTKGIEPTDSGSENSWGEMPWDFNQ